MKIIKIFIVCIVVAVFGIQNANAQQMNRRTQFNLNPYFMNPAYAGTKLYTPVYLSYRNQWTGFDSAPTTYYLSTHVSLVNNFGMGLNVIRDEAGGAITNSQVELTGSYSMDLNSENAFSVGISALVNQFVFDGTDMTLLDANDPVLFGEKEQSLNFDGNIGVMLYGKSYFIGASVPQFLQSKHNIETNNELIPNKNARHYYLMGNYEFEIKDGVKLIPAALLKFLSAIPPQIDISAQIKMNDTFWFGAGYRHQDAFTSTVGMHYNNVIVAYAFDFTLTDASTFSPFTHEVTLGYNIQRKNSRFVKKSLSSKRIKRSRKVR